MSNEEEILRDFVDNEHCEYVYDWQGFDWETICPAVDKILKKNKELKEQLKMCKEFNEGLENHIKKLNDVLVKMPLEKTLMQCEIDTYKSRIDKAIEYIEDYRKDILDGGKALLGILKGDK